MTVVWVFPGQGAQHVGMGADVLDRYPHLCREADDILGYSVRALCLDGAAPGLGNTRHVQPALFVVEALSWLARREQHPAPAAVAGHSVGEYAALFAAGCFDFATGVRLVRQRGELMARATGGGMLAVVGVQADRLAALLERCAPEVDVANRNSAAQVVLAGPAGALDRVAGEIRDGRLGRSVPLNVSAPFHSRYLAAAAAEFAGYLDGVAFADPAFPVIANVTARPYPPGQVRALLVRQVDSPVRWWESMSGLLAGGVDDLVEVGPGRVLTRLWADIRRQQAPVEAAPVARVPVVAAAAAPVTAPAHGPSEPRVRAELLGSAAFRREYGLRYAYLAGAMFQGVASAALVVRLARAGLMGFFGAGGLSLAQVQDAIVRIRGELGPAGRYGMNLLATPDDPAAERSTVDLYLRHDVRDVEAAGYVQPTAGVVAFRYAGAGQAPDGTPVAVRRVVAKVSRPEVAAAFLRPPPADLLARLVAEGALTEAEAAAANGLPVASDLCVEADSGGHTDAGSPYALMPAMRRLRDEAVARYGYAGGVQLGAAGGLGSPESVAAAFVLGADFVMTGSVNQCTPEAGTSDAVKDLLAGLDVQDTAYAPAGDMFELGARAQVVRKGTLFPARANKLYQVYRQVGGLDEIDAPTRTAIEERYFRRSFEQVWDETREYLSGHRADDVARAERDPKVKMALVFRWYFAHSARAALAGSPDERVNYQIHCGPAMGTFNRVVAGTPMQPWRARHVDAIAELLMTGAAELLDGVVPGWTGAAVPAGA